MNDGKFHCGVLIRVGSTEKILDQYENRYLRFGCPANWINYARVVPAAKCKMIQFDNFSEDLSTWTVGAYGVRGELKEEG